MQYTDQQKDAIINQAREVRRLQKLYFKSRNSLVMEQSKKAEVELDRLLDGREPVAAAPGLFDSVKVVGNG